MKLSVSFFLLLFSLGIYSQSPIISYTSPKVYTTGTPIGTLMPTNTGGEATLHGLVSTLASVGGQTSGLIFNADESILYTALHNIYSVKQVALPAATVSALAGSGVAGFADGTGSAAQFGYSGTSTTPYGIAIHPITGEIYFADPGNNRIRKISISGVVTTFAGNGTAGSNEGALASATFSLPTDLYFAPNGDLYVLQSTRIRKIYKDVNGDLVIGTLKSGIPTNCFCFTYYNGYFYISDKAHKIHRLTISDGTLAVFAGSGTAGSADGTGAAATFNSPRGIKSDQYGNIFVADYSNAKIRKISPSGVVTTIAGGTSTGTSDGEGSAAYFNGPFGLVFDAIGNLYVGNTASSNIRKIIINPYSISPALPAGLSFNTSTGEITGTPTVASAATDYTVTAYNTSGSSATTLNITVNSPIVISTTNPTLPSLGLTTASDVIISATGTLTIDAPTTINNLTIERGGKLNNTSSLSVSNFTINSDDSGVGTYVETNSGLLNIAGTVNVNQKLTGLTGASTRANWYLSSPVSAATAGTFNVGGLVNKLTYYNEATTAYVSQLTTNTTPLEVGKGYVTYIGGNDGTFTFTTNTGTATSKLNTGEITLNPTRTGTNAAKRGFNLIGNPYPSFLDWNAVIKTNVRSTIWYRTYTGSNMQFDSFDGTTGTSNGINGAVSKYIPPMQAFWVKVNADGSNGSLVLNNNMRSHQNQNLENRLRMPSAINPTIIRLKISNGTNGDETILVGNSNATDGFDDYDSPKMTNNDASIPEVFTLADNEELVINNLKEITAGKELALGFRVGINANFTIQLTEINNLDSDIKIILKDKILTSEVDITDGRAYSFNAVPINTNTRFSLIFKSKSITTGLDYNANKRPILSIYKDANNQITVINNESATTQGLITVSNPVGQILVSSPISGTKTVISKQLSRGLYFVTVKVADTKTTQKVIVN